MKDLSAFQLSNQIENDKVSVNHLFFPAHSQTEWHRHERDYVIVPLEDAVLIMESETGAQRVELKRGQCYYRDAGVEHNVINDNGFDVTLIEVEIKP